MVFVSDAHLAEVLYEKPAVSKRKSQNFPNRIANDNIFKQHLKPL
jgi:hypothetical protein